jgi:putative ABC transport system substrate-binding protein
VLDHPTPRRQLRHRSLVALSLTCALLILLAGCSGSPLMETSSASVKRLPRIGWLGGALVGPNFRLIAFRQGMLDVGFVEGQHCELDYRLGEPDQLQAQAAELVNLKVDLILASGTQASLAAKRATSTIPIVMGGTADPVGVGLVASLARPGGNVTGMTLLSSQVSGKRLQLLKDTIPGLSRVAVLFNPDNPLYSAVWIELQAAATTLQVQASRAEIRGPGDFERAMDDATATRADALFVPADQLTTNNRARIVELAARTRMRTLYELREFVDEGGLMSYGPNVADLYRRAAVRHVVDILKGARPEEIPVEQPTKFDFVINMKTAQALGLTLPQSVLLQATDVIN